jgi:hypothetical protein
VRALFRFIFLFPPFVDGLLPQCSASEQLSDLSPTLRFVSLFSERLYTLHRALDIGFRRCDSAL